MAHQGMTKASLDVPDRFTRQLAVYWTHVIFNGGATLVQIIPTLENQRN